MKKRELFVFSGQSNMMGAASLPVKNKLEIKDQYEYKHKNVMLGGKGEFVKATDRIGEFSFADFDAAYKEGMTDENGLSLLTKYHDNTYFCPAMANYDEKAGKEFDFDVMNEAKYVPSPSYPYYFAYEWEKLRYKCAFSHIAKGAVSLEHYFSREMQDEYAKMVADYNAKNDTSFNENLPLTEMEYGASAYFDKKCLDFFSDAEKRFDDEKLGEKSFFWLQGEGNANDSVFEYKAKLTVLWNHLKKIGFTKFFCIRIGYWSDKNIWRVMKAEEDFCNENEGCYMLTRAMSYFDHPNEEILTGWFMVPPTEEYKNCRDSFLGYTNNHINAKGHSVLAAHSAPNAERVLYKNEEPVLEKENIISLL